MKLKERKKMLKRKSILMVSICLLLIFSITGTIAYLTDITDTTSNSFVPGNVTTEITENFDGNVKNDVAIKNNGNIPAYIRAMVVVTWQDENGNVYGEVPLENTHYEMKWCDEIDTSTSWEKAQDGFYYYKAPVNEGDSTSVLFTKCALKDDITPPTGYSLHVEIIASGIQSMPTSVVTTEWSSGVDSVNGTTLVIK